MIKLAMVAKGFGWLRMVLDGFWRFRIVSDGFGWFAVLVVTTMRQFPKQETSVSVFRMKLQRMPNKIANQILHHSQISLNFYRR